MKRILAPCLACFVLLLAMIPRAAWTPPQLHCFPLDAIPVTDCNESWNGDDSYWLHFVETTVDDCAEAMCDFSAVEEGVRLGGARLEFVTSYWCSHVAGGIDDAVVVCEDQCRAGCKRVSLYCDDVLLFTAANVSSEPREEIAVHETEMGGNRLVISSCGAIIEEVSI